MINMDTGHRRGKRTNAVPYVKKIQELRSFLRNGGYIDIVILLAVDVHEVGLSDVYAFAQKCSGYEQNERTGRGDPAEHKAVGGLKAESSGAPRGTITMVEGSKPEPDKVGPAPLQLGHVARRDEPRRFRAGDVDVALDVLNVFSDILCTTGRALGLIDRPTLTSRASLRHGCPNTKETRPLGSRCVPL